VNFAAIRRGLTCSWRLVGTDNKPSDELNL
jgi:hypothetical protein